VVEQDRRSLRSTVTSPRIVLPPGPEWVVGSTGRYHVRGTCVPAPPIFVEHQFLDDSALDIGSIGFGALLPAWSAHFSIRFEEDVIAEPIWCLGWIRKPISRACCTDTTSLYSPESHLIAFDHFSRHW
jgi:hypothetical protein